MLHIKIFKSLIKSCAPFAVIVAVVCTPSPIYFKVHWSAETVCMDKVQPAWLQKLGLICSCGCYLHETFRTAPLTMKWLEEGGKKNETWMIHCCQAIFALVFQAGPCTYSLENFQHCSRSSESFKMFVRNGKSVTGDGGGKNPNRFHVCVVVIKCRPVSGCAVSLFVFHTRRLQYNFLSFFQDFLPSFCKCIYTRQTK